LDEAIATDRGTTLPAALAEPAVPAPPEQVQSLHDHVVKNNAVPSGTDAVLLSVVMSVGATAGLIANPIVGALSDRTTSPRGHRHPWTFGCALVAALGLAVVAASPTGKDAGIINMGYNLPLVVAPLAAGVLLGLMNSYPALFALSGFVTIIASGTVTRVRSVR
jgi:hypothetical protein